MCSVIPHVPVRDDGAAILGPLTVLGWPHVFRGPVRRLFGIEQSLVDLARDVP